MKRDQIGETLNHKGSKVTVHHVGPDVIAAVDGKELPNFYLNAEAARKAGMKYIDEIQKEKK